MRAALALVCVAVTSAPADSLAVRVSAGAGKMREPTWTAPGVALVASHRFEHAFAHLELGYSPIDNHTYLADGQVIRFAAAAGTQLGPRLRVAGVVDLESIGFHADPDVLAEHPGVDVAPRRGGFVPAAGAELTLQLTDTTSIGVFGRVALRRLELFDAPGDRGDARLVLGGVYLELRLH